MSNKAALVPMESLAELGTTSGTQIALDLDLGNGLVHLVGTYCWAGRVNLGLILPDNKGNLTVSKKSIVKAYWAPAGYRP